MKSIKTKNRNFRPFAGSLNKVAAMLMALVSGTLILFSTSANATPEEVGLQIAQEVDLRDSGFVDNTADLQMILRNRHGQESKRLIRTRTLEVNGDGDKSLIIFDHPRDICRAQ